MTTNFRILSGLPAYGAPAEPFPSSGYGAHREGTVVEFEDMDGTKWIGNFQPGLNAYNAVFATFGVDRPIVIAGGSGYGVDAPTRKVIEEFGGTIDWALEWHGRLIFADGIRFVARNRDGVVWKSDRVSWDGMRDLSRDGRRVRGFAYSPLDDDHHSFDLDLETGNFSGGSYNGPP